MWELLASGIWQLADVANTVNIVNKDSASSVSSSDRQPSISTLGALQILTGEGKVATHGGTPPALSQCIAKWRHLPVVDIGTHDGSDYTIPAALCGHRVYSYEPTEHKFDSIIRTLDEKKILHTEDSTSFTRAKPGTVLFRKALAVSDRSGWAMFSYTPPGKALGVANSLNRGALPPRQAHIARQANVTLVSLDEDLATEENGVYMIKIDAQGNELNVLLGARRYISTHPVPLILLEYNAKGLAAAKASGLELLQMLTVELGYTCFDMRVKDDPKANTPKKNGPLPLDAFVRKYSGHFSSNNGYGPETDLQCIRFDLL